MGEHGRARTIVPCPTLRWSRLVSRPIASLLDRSFRMCYHFMMLRAVLPLVTGALTELAGPGSPIRSAASDFRSLARTNGRGYRHRYTRYTNQAPLRSGRTTVRRVQPQTRQSGHDATTTGDRGRQSRRVQHRRPAGQQQVPKEARCRRIPKVAPRKGEARQKPGAETAEPPREERRGGRRGGGCGG